ncbi:MAG: methyl-accepting chemotaxis protein, partial [Nitrospirota bacterium]|nr:methyl-accepting chemotaxis protein [Nitrospirota bacterium]
MKLLKNLSIKSFLIGVLAILTSVLVIESLTLVVSNYTHGREVERVDVSNEMADDLLEASGYYAKERGMTSMALNMTVPVPPQTLQNINEVRTKGDAALKKAATLYKKLTESLDPTNALLVASQNQMQTAYDAFVAERRKVDATLSKDQKTVDASELIQYATDLIESTSTTRLAAFTSTASETTLQEALRLNLELKQAIWLASEYSGRERALIAKYITNKRPLDMNAIERLNTFRSIVDINMNTILRLKQTSGINSGVINKVKLMESVFLTKFESTRRSVIGTGVTGAYSISGPEWIAASSEGIDSILDVSAEVGTMADEKIMAALASSKRAVYFSVIVLIIVLALGVGSIMIISLKVISPMLYLNKTMNTIETSGDLTLKIAIETNDESGQIAQSFNSMMNRVHDVILDINRSAEMLASSSEELSASASQIADGTKSQNARASQVATSAEQMSSTIIEVSKNVSNASDAVREANTVAVHGGDVVTKTIESMNGIAFAAKESNSIISTLGERSKEIGNIITVIDDIADQTNLLALNAAIEAARAGEQGRGFAVVADEVRKLAEKTMKATKEIGDMIKTMQNETTRANKSMQNEISAVSKGVELAGEAGMALKEIVSRVDVVTQMMQQMATAMEEQSAATEQISGDIESVATVINETTQSAQQIATAS